ncbi:MAG: hypothetical protein ACE366_24440 [Bradymonadia bacterium]
MRRDYEVVEEIIEEEIVEEYYEEDEGSGIGGLLIGLLALLLIGGGVALAWHKGWIGGSKNATVAKTSAPVASAPAVKIPGKTSSKAAPQRPTGNSSGKRPPVKPVMAGTAGVWDGRRPFKCGGHQIITLSDVQAVVPGQTPAITAAGDCQLTLKNVRVEAGVALYAAGHARVLVQGGELKGSDKALKAWGEAQVTLEGVNINGPVDQKGRAQIKQ